MFRPTLAIMRFTSERVLVFVRFMRLCNDGEIPSSALNKPPPQRRPDNPRAERTKTKCAASQGMPRELDGPAKIRHIYYPD